MTGTSRYVARRAAAVAFVVATLFVVVSCETANDRIEQSQRHARDIAGMHVAGDSWFHA